MVTSLLTISVISARRSSAAGEGEVSDVRILWALGSGLWAVTSNMPKVSAVVACPMPRVSVWCPCAVYIHWLDVWGRRGRCT